LKEDTKPVAGEDEQGVVESDSTPGMSLTRKAALGVGAAALGGAALGGLADVARAGTAQATATVPDGAVFKTVLTKLASNATFRKQALQDPSLITKSYPSLSKLQLEALRDCAILSGANIASINKVRAAAISTASSQAAAGAIVVSGHSIGWSISCCSCCCCCCGETAVLVRP
jgi:hypothetical protein